MTMLDTKDRRQIVGKGYVSVPSITSIPLTKIARDKHHLAIKYKALAFHEDRKNASLASVSSFVIEEKRVPPVFNADLNTWQCAEGTRYGGRFTDKFGRGCGGGILRRLGSALGRLADGKLPRSLEGLGERRDLRRLARYSARQSYRDELAQIRQAYPSLGRRALRRIGGTFQRIDNALTAGPPQIRGRRQRGAKPQRPSIVSRFADRSGAAYERLVNRVLYGRRKGQKGKRTSLVSRVARRKQRSQTPKQPGVIRRLSDRAGAAYERLIDRVLYGPQQRGRRGRRGLVPAQGGATVVLPKKPKTPRAKKKKAVVQKTKPKPVVPAKKIKKVGKIDVPNLDLVQQEILSKEAKKQLAYLDKFWRDRLGIPAGEEVTEEAIAKYIQDRIDAGKPGGYIGMLKANANDYKALQSFQAKLNNGEADAFDELNKLGPTRRQKMLDILGVTPPPKPAPTKKPAKKPAKPKPKPEATAPEVVVPEEAPQAEVSEETSEPETPVTPQEPTPEEDLPDWLKPLPEQETPAPEEQETADEELGPETEEAAEPVLPDFLMPEPPEDEVPEAEQPGIAVIEDPISTPDPLPPIPQSTIVTPEQLDDPDVATDLANENIGIAQAQETFTDEVHELLKSLNIDVNGAINGKLYDVDADSFEEAMADAKAISQQLADAGYDDEVVALVQMNVFGTNKYIVTLPSVIDLNKASNQHINFGMNVPTFKQGLSLGTLKWFAFEKLANETKATTTVKKWSSAGIIEKQLTTKGIAPEELGQVFNDLEARAKTLKKHVFLLAARGINKKIVLIGGTAEEIDARIKELGLDKDSTNFSLLVAYDHINGHIHLTDDLDQAKLEFKSGTTKVVLNGEKWLSISPNEDFNNSVLDVLSGYSEKMNSIDASMLKINPDKGVLYGKMWKGSTSFASMEWLKKQLAEAQSGTYTKFKLVRRAGQDVNFASFNLKLGWLYSEDGSGLPLGSLLWQASELPSDTGPNNIFGLLTSMKGQFGADTNEFLAYLVRVNTPKGVKWQILDKERLAFATQQGIIGKNDVLLKLRTYWGSQKIGFNTKFKSDGSNSDQNPSYSMFEMDDISLLSASINNTVPELGLPLIVDDDSIIEIDESYLPGTPSQVKMLDVGQATQILIDHVSNTEAGQKFLVAAKLAAKNDFLGKKPFAKLTVAEIEAEIEKAKNDLDNALATIPVESSAYGAIANTNKPSHNKAAKALARLEMLEQLASDKIKQADIEQVSKVLAGKLKSPSFNPTDITTNPTDITTIDSTGPLTNEQAKLVASLVETLSGLPKNPAFDVDKIDNWFPALSNTANSVPGANLLASVNFVIHEWLAQKKWVKQDVTATEFVAKNKSEIRKRLIEKLQGIENATTLKFWSADGAPQMFYLIKTREYLEDILKNLDDETWLTAENLSGVLEKTKALIYEDFADGVADGVIQPGMTWRSSQDPGGLLSASKVGVLIADIAEVETVANYLVYLDKSPAFIKGVLNPPKAIEPQKLPKPQATINWGEVIDFGYGGEINIPDTFGLMLEYSTGSGKPVLAWLSSYLGESVPKVWRVGDVDEFEAEVNAGFVSSVLGGVTPNGSIYVAQNSNPALNPNGKWLSKFKKYGTGGFATPTGAQHVFDDEDEFTNLDLLTDKFEGQHIGVSGDAKWKIQELSAPAASVVPPEENTAGLYSKAEFAASTNLSATGLSYAEAHQLLNIYGLDQLLKDQSGQFPLVDKNGSRALFIVSGPGDNGPRFYLVSVDNLSDEERNAAKEFFKDKTLIAAAMYQAGFTAKVEVTAFKKPQKFIDPLDGSETKFSTLFDYEGDDFENALTIATLDNPQVYLDIDGGTKLDADVSELGNFSAALDASIVAALAFPKKSINTFSLDTAIEEWFAEEVFVPDVDNKTTVDDIFAFVHDANIGGVTGYDGPTVNTDLDPYVDATRSTRGIHLLVPYLSALFTHLNDKGVLPDSTAMDYDSPAYEAVAGKIQETPGTPLGRLLTALADMVEQTPSLKSSGAALTKQQFDHLLGQAVGGNNSPLDIRDFANALRHQIQSLSVGGGLSISRLEAMLSSADDPAEYASYAVDPMGVSLSSMEVVDLVNLIAKNKAISDISFYNALKSPDASDLHPIAHNAGLIGRRSSEMTFVRAVMSAIRLRQEKDPEGAAVVRAALRDYVQTGLVLSGTPDVYKSKVMDWLNAGGYPDLKPATKIYDQTTGIPVTSIGAFDPSILGSVSANGKAVANHVPVHAAIPDLQTASAHIASGGKLSEVPDIFLREAIIENMGAGKRFLVDSSVQEGFNGGTFGFLDTASPGSEPGTYLRYVVKFADRNKAEHIQEMMGSQIEHRLGLFAVGHRLASNSVEKLDKQKKPAIQRAIVQEHIANLFQGSSWKVLGHWGNVPSDAQLDPENLARFVALNRFINHYDRTPANVIAVQAPDGKIHIVPIDDGNAFYAFMAKNDSMQPDFDLEQATGFTKSVGVGINFFEFTSSMSPEDKMTFAVALRESVAKFANMDLDEMQQEMIDAFPWSDVELAHIASRFDHLRERRDNRDWAAMLKKAYKSLGVTTDDVENAFKEKQQAVYASISANSASNSPQAALQSLVNLPKRNLSANYLWDGPSIDRQQVLVGSATLVSSPFEEDSGKLAMYTTFQLAGDAREKASNLADGVDGWAVLKNKSGAVVTKPVSASYRQLVGTTASGAYGNKRSLVLDKASTEFGINGKNYYKKLDDGTVVVVFVADNKNDVFTGYATTYKTTNDANNAILSIPDAGESMGAVLGEFGAISEPPSEETLALSAMKQLVYSLKGGAPQAYDNMDIGQLQALLSSWGISASDLEMAFDWDGSPYMRLTKSARDKIASTVNKPMIKHRYYHHDDGEVKAFANTVITGRLGSARRRIPHGIPGAGWSTSADSGYQSNDYVFFKFGGADYSDPKLSVFDENMSDELLKKHVADSGATHIYSYFPVEFAIERPDTRWTTRDVFGNINAHVSISESASSTSYPEPLIRDSMPMARGIHVVPASMYDDVMLRIKAQGVTQIAGIPIEALIISSDDSVADAWKTLRQYWIDLGWV